MDQEKEIVIPVKLDERTFKRFARFDMFVLRKKWVRPAVFSLILLGFAAIALIVLMFTRMRRRKRFNRTASLIIFSGFVLLCMMCSALSIRTGLLPRRFATP